MISFEHAVLVSPVDVAEQVVECPEDVGQRVELGLGPMSAASCRYRPDLRVLVREEHADGCLLLDAVAVHVDRIDALREVVLARSRPWSTTTRRIPARGTDPRDRPRHGRSSPPVPRIHVAVVRGADQRVRVRSPGGSRALPPHRVGPDPRPGAAPLPAGLGCRYRSTTRRRSPRHGGARRRRSRWQCQAERHRPEQRQRTAHLATLTSRATQRRSFWLRPR